MRSGKPRTARPRRTAHSPNDPQEGAGSRGRRPNEAADSRDRRPAYSDMFDRGIWELVDPDEEGETEPEPGDFWLQPEMYDE